MMKKLFRRLIGVTLCVCLLLGAVSPAMASILMITQQPQSVAVPEGETAVVTVTVKGEGLQYEWWYAPKESNVFEPSAAGGDVPNQYAFVMDEAHDGCKVYCIVSDAYGHMMQTKTATVYLMTPLAVIAQPQNTGAVEGEMFTVSVEASGAELTYAWWFANAGTEEFSQSEETTSVYEMEMNDLRDGRRIYCVITDKFGQTVQTDTITVTEYTPLLILAQPAHASAAVGESVELSVQAQGDGVQYAWWRINAFGQAAQTSCTDAQMTVEMDEKCDGMQVYCVVTDERGNSVQSDAAMLGLIPEGLSYELREDAAAVTDYTGEAEVVKIPAVIAGRPVTEISAGAFAACEKLVSITLPDSLQEMGSAVFAGCEKLRCVVVPSAIEQIEEIWFADLDQTNVKICCDAGSFAESWAQEHGFAVQLLDKGDVIHMDAPARLTFVCGEAQQLSYTLYTADGSAATDAISFASSDETIATVDENGFVTMLDDADAVITISAASGVTAQCTVTGECVYHKGERLAAVAPTCTENGLTEGMYCMVCDEILIAQEVIPATGGDSLAGDDRI